MKDSGGSGRCVGWWQRSGLPTTHNPVHYSTTYTQSHNPMPHYLVVLNSSAYISSWDYSFYTILCTALLVVLHSSAPLHSGGDYRYYYTLMVATVVVQLCRRTILYYVMYLLSCTITGPLLTILQYYSIHRIHNCRSANQSQRTILLPPQ